MVTKEERERLFREDFEALMKKHGAGSECTASDHGDRGWPRCVCEIVLHSEYDQYGNLAMEYTEFEL